MKRMLGIRHAPSGARIPHTGSSLPAAGAAALAAAFLLLTACGSNTDPTNGDCTPACQDLQCGNDGCGGTCGTCSVGQSCTSAGQCITGTCTPSCTGKQCGDDGCGGTCGACSVGQTCSSAGQCITTGCIPACTGKECGDDGCGGTCGTCEAGQTCGTDGQCSLSVGQLAVGAWQGSATCTSGTDSITFEYGYIVCPQGRLRGYETIDGWDFLDCGTWQPGTIGTSPALQFSYTYTAVADSTFTGSDEQYFLYEPPNDRLKWYASCTLYLNRLVGGVTEEDCTSTTCTAGGSGAITGCGTDCDCGRCWYCEKVGSVGTCRYGGEGSYGCYRGCE